MQKNQVAEEEEEEEGGEEVKGAARAMEKEEEEEEMQRKGREMQARRKVVMLGKLLWKALVEAGKELGRKRRTRGRATKIKKVESMPHIRLLKNKSPLKKIEMTLSQRQIKRITKGR